MNEQLVRWFESGNAASALLGGEPYFIPETTYRDHHDRLLVLDQLLLWAVRDDELYVAADAFLDALRRAVADLDLAATYDLVWCFLLVRDEHEAALPVDMDNVVALLDVVDRKAVATGERDRAMQQRVRKALADTK